MKTHTDVKHEQAEVSKKLTHAKIREHHASSADTSTGLGQSLSLAMEYHVLRAPFQDAVNPLPAWETLTMESRAAGRCP